MRVVDGPPVLVLAYKPGTSVVEATAGVDLARALVADGVAVKVYDPLGMPDAAKLLPDRVAYANSVEACASGADVVVITTPWPDFAGMSPGWFDGARGRVTIIDCWRQLSPATFAEVADVVHPGAAAL